jgi:hypothetical protein
VSASISTNIDLAASSATTSNEHRDASDQHEEDDDEVYDDENYVSTRCIHLFLKRALITRID